MFLFKKKIFLKDDDREMEDTVAKDLIYKQVYFIFPFYSFIIFFINFFIFFFYFIIISCLGFT